MGKRKKKRKKRRRKRRKRRQRRKRKTIDDESSYCWEKASFHLVFPDIIVDRPFVHKKPLQWPKEKQPMSNHAIVHEHVRNFFADRIGDSHELLEQCEYEIVAKLDDEDEVVYLNSWNEVFDEN